MRRLIAFTLVLAFLVLACPTRTLAAVSIVNQWKNFVATSSTPVVVTTATTSGDTLYAFYWTQNSTACVTVTANSGWTIDGDSGCVLTRNRLTVLRHTATGETSDQPLASLSGAANQNVIIYDVSGVGGYDVTPQFATMANNTTTPAVPAITTTKSNDVVFAVWGTQIKASTASSITAGWTQYDQNNGAFVTVGTQSFASPGAITPPTVSYSSANSSGIVASMAITPPASSLQISLGSAHAGGFHVSSPVANTVSSIETYNPSVLYVGNATGEGGLCGGTGPYTPCPDSQATIQAANIKYIEGFLGDTHMDPATGDWVGFPYCTTSAGSCALGYSSFISNACSLPGQTNVFNDLTGANTTGYLHNGGASGTSYLNGGPSGSCGSYTSRVWQNPADATGWAKILADFTGANATGNTTINGRSWYTQFQDNFELPPSTTAYSSASTAEYGTQWPNAAQNSQRDLGKYLAGLSPYPQIVNTLTSGGGHYGLCTAAVGANCADGAHASVGTTGAQAYMRFSYLQCDNDTTGNLVGMLAERALMSGGPASAVQWLGYYNIPVLANTLSWVYNDNNCNGVNILDLEPIAASGSNLPAARIGALGLRLLLEPNGYDGLTSTRAFMQWEYTDCGSCHNTIAVMPEYGLVMVNPSPSIGKWVYGQDANTDGNGCGAHDSGGIASLLIGGTCTGTDEQGKASGVYHRSGQCYVFGVYKGNCTVLWNDTKSTHTISNSWCDAGCSSLPYEVSVTGNEEQYLADDSASGILNPNATGAYGTNAAATTIGTCEISSSNLATPCFKVLIQNP